MDQQKLDYFKRRLGDKLNQFINYTQQCGFVLFFLAKKQAGKGTYIKILQELTNGRIIQISIGDLVREAEAKAKDSAKRKELIQELKKYYQGELDLEAVADLLVNQSVENKLLPTDVITALITMSALEKNLGQPIIIDGFPRGKDQVLVALQMQKDFLEKNIPAGFVAIDCPDEVLARRYIYRRSCPVCSTPRNIKLLLTKEIEYDENTGEFYLICDNMTCEGKHIRMRQKQADDLGPDALKEKQKLMVEIMQEIQAKAGDNYLIVHNTVPINEATPEMLKEDFTEEADLSWNEKEQEVARNFKPIQVADDQGREAYSRWPEAVVVEMVEKLVEWLSRFSW
jgi:adenylate kinase family enzyme